MREKLLEEINKNLESASEDVLKKMNDILTGYVEAKKEKATKRGLLFAKIVNFIRDCSDINITDGKTGELKALGVVMSDNVEIIHPLAADYIEIQVDDKLIFKFYAQDSILMALEDLFKEIRFYE